MNSDNLRAQKNVLELDITKRLNEFENSTGLSVESINFVRITDLKTGNTCVVTSEITVIL